MSAPDPTEIAANLCRVALEGDEVVIHFGQAIDATEAPGIWHAAALQRIAMSEGGAAKLQDLLVDLLRVPDPGSPKKP